mmetsp:Transcript_62288/g.100810  ORF Transcript_62288/g.100810 Transcript_62288/m.100810 type:complete len:558 (-) Transcript_62288:219-1892(-)
MAFPAMAQETMASYIEQLLLLDQNRQRATLDSLSQYCETKSLNDHQVPKISASSAHEMPLVGTGFESYTRPLPAWQNEEMLSHWDQARFNRETHPLKVMEPLRVPMAQPVTSYGSQDGGSSQKLQQATHMLQAALANWEACVQTKAFQESSTSQVFCQGQVSQPTLCGVAEESHKSTRSSPPGLGFQASGFEADSVWESNMRVGSDHVLKRDQETLKLLMLQHLERQNTASMQKFHQLSQASEASMMALGGNTGGWETNLRAQGVAAKTVQAGRPLSPPQEHSSMGTSPMAYGSLNSASAGPMPMQGSGNRWGETGAKAAPAGPVASQPHQQLQQQMWQQLQQLQRLQKEMQMQRQVAVMQQQEQAASGAMVASKRGGGPKRRVTGATVPDAAMADGPQPAETHQGETLRMHLRSLLSVDSSRVLIVRKINRLGFSSPTTLKEHYSWYGAVENVLVAHSRVKSGSGQAGIVSRLRPSGLGFIVMSTIEEAESILKGGQEQLVCGSVIRVQKFERRMAELEEERMSEEEKTSSSQDEVEKTSTSGSSGSTPDSRLQGA